MIEAITYSDDVPPKWPYWSTATLDEARAMLADGGYTTDFHPVIDDFETRFARAHQTKFALSCSSGTAGLLSAYFALGLEREAEVLVPTWTFRATVTPLLLLGLRPVFCDVDEFGNIDLDDARARVTSSTQAVVATHVNGRPVDLLALRGFADANHLALIEDASHAHGCQWDGVSVGSVGDVSVFSCGTTKMVSGGMLGVIVSDDQRIIDRACLFSQPKHRARRTIADTRLRGFAGTGLGVNFRASPIAALLAIEHLSNLSATSHRKNRNLSQLELIVKERFLGAIRTLPRPRSWTGTSYKLLAQARSSAERDKALKRLGASGLDVRAPVRPLHMEPLWLDPSILATAVAPSLREAPILPNAERLWRRSVEFSTRELYADAEGFLKAVEERLVVMADD